MIKLVSDTLWQEIKLLAASSRTKMAAVAYVTDDAAVKFDAGDVLIVDASDHAIKSGQTSAVVLEQALKRGANLFSCPNLHAKVILFDSIAVAGSSNISKSSQLSLVEAAVITDQASVVSKSRLLIEQIKARSIPIDAAFITRIKALPVNQQGHKLGAKPPIKLGEHRTWIVSVVEQDGSRYMHEIPVIESGTHKAERSLANSDSEIDWIRFRRGVRHLFGREAQEGDSVIQLWQSQEGSVTCVMPPLPILVRQEESSAIRFYVERFTGAETDALTWQQFQRLTKKIGVPGAITVNSVRLLPDPYAEALQSLWKS